MTTAWDTARIAELRDVMQKLSTLAGDGTYLLMETKEQGAAFFGKDAWLDIPCIVTERRSGEGGRAKPLVQITVKSNQHYSLVPSPLADKRIEGLSLSCEAPWELRSQYDIRSVGRTFKRIKKSGEYNLVKLHEAVTKFIAEVDKAEEKLAKRKSDAEVGLEAVEKALKHGGLPCSRVKDWLDRKTKSIETEAGGHKIVLNVASPGFVSIAGQRLPSFPAANSAQVVWAYLSILRAIEADTVE